MKRGVSIFLLFVLTAPFIGTYAWLRYEKRQTRREVKARLIAGMDKTGLILLTFSKHESETILHWEHDREFEYLGRMYDVVETRMQNDSVWYWCWPDHAETRLNRQLEHLLAQAGDDAPQRREKEQQLLHFFKTVYLPVCFPWQLHAPLEQKKLLPQPDAGTFASRPPAPEAPPPEMV